MLMSTPPRQLALQERSLRNTVRFVWSGFADPAWYVASQSPEAMAPVRALVEIGPIGSPNYGRFVFDGDGSDGGSGGFAGSGIIVQEFAAYFTAVGLPMLPEPRMATLTLR